MTLNVHGIKEETGSNTYILCSACNLISQTYVYTQLNAKIMLEFLSKGID